MKTTAYKDVYDWGEMIWLADGRHAKDINLSLAKMIVKPGLTSEPHCHDNCFETIHVLQGRLREYFNDQAFDLEAGDTLIVPKGTRHCSENIGEGDLIMMIAYSESDRNYTPA